MEIGSFYVAPIMKPRRGGWYASGARFLGIELSSTCPIYLKDGARTGIPLALNGFGRKIRRKAWTMHDAPRQDERSAWDKVPLVTATGSCPWCQAASWRIA